MTLPAPLLRWRIFRSTGAVLAVCGAVTLGLMLLAASVMLLARRDATRDADRSASNIARAAGQDIARTLGLYDLALRTVARQVQQPAVRALPPDLRQALLFDGAARDADFGFINVLDAHGDVIADSASVTPRRGNFGGRDYFLAQRHGSTDRLFIGEPFDRIHGRFTLIALSRRLSNQDGSFAGVVMGTVRLAYFARLFAAFAIGPHGTITLLHDSGAILQRRPAAPDDIGHVAATTLLQTVHPLLPTDAADPVDRHLRHFVLYRVPGLPLTVAVGLAPQDIYAAWRQRAAVTLLSVLALGLLNAALMLRLRHAVRTQRASEATLREKGMELVAFAQQRSDALAAEKQAHDRRARRLSEVSHDMRTLLHGILGNADLVRSRGDLNGEQAHCLAALRSAAEHLRETANRFLHDVGLGDEAARPDLKPTDLHALLDQCRAMIELAAEEKGLQVAFETDPRLPDLIVTDATRLGVILWNLLDNAIKYTDRGSVTLNASREANGVQFVIVDTGRGMPAAQRRKLQDDPSTGDPQPGLSGLGLSIVRRRTGELGGTIQCMSNPGGGTIICLTLPARPVPATTPGGFGTPAPQSREPGAPVPQSSAPGTAAPQSREPGAPALQSREPSAPVPELRGPGAPVPELRRPGAPTAGEALRVLVVDDSEISRDTTAGLLRAAGLQVSEANSGEAAVDCARDGAFDAVVMDVRMAGISGLDAAQQIRALPGQAGQAPIILLSAQLPDDAHAAWQMAGIDTCLEKPCDQMRLLQAIRRTTGRGSAGGTPVRPRDDNGIAPHHFQMLADEVSAMVAMLEDDGRSLDDEALGDQVHRVAGDAAELRFTALAQACRDFERAARAGDNRTQPARVVHQAAQDALHSLSQRLQDPRKGVARSASPV